MMFFFLSAILLLLVCAVFWFFMNRKSAQINQSKNADLHTYMDQLKSVESDVERGIVSDDEATAMRTEIQRRILDAGRKHVASSHTSTASHWTLVACFLGVTGIAAILYLTLGSPSLPDQPLASRIAQLEIAKAQRPSQQEAEAVTVPNLPRPSNVDEGHLNLVNELRQAVSDRPNDVRGLRLLVQQEIRLGNYIPARETQETLIGVLGNSASVDELANLFDIMLYNADDYISPQAEAVLMQLRRKAPDLLLGQFYQGMLEIQTGRLDKAFQTWKPVAEQSPPNAPWFEFVRGEMPALAAAAGVKYELPPAQPQTRGPSASDIEAAKNMSGGDRQAMIEDMVASLSERLANEGGTPKEWQQLIRAMTVLGQVDQARTIAQEARVKFAADPTTIDQLNGLISELGLD